MQKKTEAYTYDFIFIKLAHF